MVRTIKTDDIDKDGKYICKFAVSRDKICGRKYANLANLKRHMHAQHGGKK